MAVDILNHLPAVRPKAGRRVIGKPSTNLAINGDAIVVPKGN